MESKSFNNKEKVQLFFIFIVVFILVSNSIRLTFDGYYGFYYQDEEYENSFFDVTEEISNLWGVRHFSSYTGFETGYGFFSPNVASDFIFIFNIFDENNNLKEVVNGVRLKTKESNIRFQTINTMYLDKLKEPSQKGYNEKYNRYLDIIMEQITKYVKKEYPKNYKIETNLYLYDYPTIPRFNEGKKEQLFFIKKYEL